MTSENEGAGPENVGQAVVDQQVLITGHGADWNRVSYVSNSAIPSWNEFYLTDQNGRVLTITADRRLVFGEGVTPAAAAREFAGHVERYLQPFPAAPDTPVHALARAILAGDDIAIAPLIDAAMERFQHCPPDHETRAKELAERVRQVPPGSVNLTPLLDKLRDLGYGEAVEAYINPARTPEGHLVFNGGGSQLLDWAAGNPSGRQIRGPIASDRFDRPHEPT